MGGTRVTGEIEINPPLTWSEVKGSPFYEAPDDYSYQKGVKLLVTEEDEETDGGTLTRKQAAALIPLMEDPYKAYTLLEDVREAVELYGKAHTFTGHLSCKGEDSGDVWRVEIHDGKAVAVRSLLMWPEDVASLRRAIDTYEEQAPAKARGGQLVEAAQIADRLAAEARALVFRVTDDAQRDDR